MELPPELQMLLVKSLLNNSKFVTKVTFKNKAIKYEDLSYKQKQEYGEMLFEMYEYFSEIKLTDEDLAKVQLIENDGGTTAILSLNAITNNPEDWVVRLHFNNNNPPKFNVYFTFPDNKRKVSFLCEFPVRFSKEHTKLDPIVLPLFNRILKKDYINKETGMIEEPKKEPMPIINVGERTKDGALKVAGTENTSIYISDSSMMGNKNFTYLKENPFIKKRK